VSSLYLVTEKTGANVEGFY